MGQLNMTGMAIQTVRISVQNREYSPVRRAGYFCSFDAAQQMVRLGPDIYTSYDRLIISVRQKTLRAGATKTQLLALCSSEY